MDRYDVSDLLEILALRHLARAIVKDRFQYPVVTNCVTSSLYESELVEDSTLAKMSLSLTTNGSKTCPGVSVGSVYKHSSKRRVVAFPYSVGVGATHISLLQVGKRTSESLKGHVQDN